MLHGMIMAGGGGTRFWPRSRQNRPKQFLTLSGDRSLLQHAFDRLESGIPAQQIWVITGQQYVEETIRQLPELPTDHIVGEPVGRDTAPCIGLGAALIEREDADAVMVVTPADHVIEPTQEFRRAIHVAEQWVKDDPTAFVTLGVPPTYPATGYGYIHRDPTATKRQGALIFKVREFKEKPDRETAERFVSSGDYYWNSGIFVWQAKALLAALRENRPQLHAAITRIADAWPTPERESVLREQYSGLEKISIDYAVMERARNVFVIEAPFRWDDVGSWLAVERMNPQDGDGNTILATHAGLKTSNSVIVADPGKLIATIGVENLIIIQSGDAILVADRREESAVKDLVERLKRDGRETYL